MRRPWGSALFLLVAAIGLAAVQRWAPGGLYTFGGHGPLLNDLVHVCLWLLAVTHALLLGIIWTQRRRWDDAEGSMFRFIGVKGLFWLYFALTLPNRDGVSLPYVCLVVLIILTTLDLDVQLVVRYVPRSRKEKP